VVDWLMRKIVENQRDGQNTGVKWTEDKALEDLDYADDLALILEGFDDLQEKAKRLDRKARSVGLKISTKKTEVMRWNSDDKRKIQVQGTELKDIERFTYLGSIVSMTGCTLEDVESRIRKAKAAFAGLNTIWKSKTYKKEPKLRLFNAIVKSTLLFGSECWTMTRKIESKLNIFHHKCLMRILQMFYPNLVTNKEILMRKRSR
jgi:hypothetical protein